MDLSQNNINSGIKSIADHNPGNEHINAVTGFNSSPIISLLPL
jgi:hypothetical protein